MKNIQAISFLFLILLLPSLCYSQNDDSFAFQEDCNWKLMWKKEIETLKGKKLIFLNYSCRKIGEFQSRLIVNKQRDNKYTLSKYEQVFKFNTIMGNSYFEEPVFFEYKPINDTSYKQFFVLQDIQFGTGNYKKEWIFHIHSNGEINEVNFIVNPVVTKLELNPKEGVWKPGSKYFKNDSLYHIHYIWNEGDGNCCPSAGRVTTNYDIVKVDSNEYIYQVRNYERVPYVHPIDANKYDE